jgi:hypothetical protein
MIPKIGDSLYCIKTDTMGHQTNPFCVKGKYYKIIRFSFSPFNGEIIIVIIDENGDEHGFYLLEIMNGEGERFIFNSKKIMIEKNIVLLLVSKI